MINTSHLVALSVVIFFAFMAKKRFFGIGDVIDGKIKKIKEDIAQSEAFKSSALSNLEAARRRLNDVDAEIKRIRHHSEKMIEILMHNKGFQVRLEQETLEKKHEYYVELMEKAYFIESRKRIVQHIFCDVKKKFQQKDQSWIENQMNIAIGYLDTVETKENVSLIKIV